MSRIVSEDRPIRALVFPGWRAWAVGCGGVAEIRPYYETYNEFGSHEDQGLWFEIRGEAGRVLARVHAVDITVEY